MFYYGFDALVVSDSTYIIWPSDDLPCGLWTDHWCQMIESYKHLFIRKKVLKSVMWSTIPYYQGYSLNFKFIGNFFSNGVHFRKYNLVKLRFFMEYYVTQTRVRVVTLLNCGTFDMTNTTYLLWPKASDELSMMSRSVMWHTVKVALNRITTTLTYYDWKHQMKESLQQKVWDSYQLTTEYCSQKPYSSIHYYFVIILREKSGFEVGADIRVGVKKFHWFAFLQ